MLFNPILDNLVLYHYALLCWSIVEIHGVWIGANHFESWTIPVTAQWRVLADQRIAPWWHPVFYCSTSSPECALLISGIHGIMGVYATLKTYHLPGTIRTVTWAFIKCCQWGAVSCIVMITGVPRWTFFSYMSWKLNNSHLLYLVSPALNVVVIWAILTCLLTQAIPVRCLWLRSLRTCSRLLRSQRWAIITSIRQIRFTLDTVIRRLSNIPTISEMGCSIHLPPTIIPRLISDNSRYFIMSNFSGFHIDSPTDIGLGISMPAR